jgi:hypothetical protein
VTRALAAALALGVAAAAAPGRAADPAADADPPAAGGRTSALRPLPNGRGTYGESFTFIGDLDDGTYVQLSLALTNFGPGGTKGLCRALVVRPGAKPWNASTRVGKEGWGWSDGEAERFKVGPCAAWIEGETTAALVPLDGGTVKLVFADRPVRRSQLRDAAVVVSGDLYRSEVLLFRSPLTATLALPGTKEVTVAGAGFADHGRSTIPPKDLARRWVRFRALRGERGLVLLGREGHDGAFKPLWACEDRDRCRDFERFRLERQGAGKSPSFRVALGGEAHVEGLSIASGTLLYRDAPVEDLGILGKLVAPIVGSPVTYVYRARAVDGAGAELEGILEVELSGE